MSGLETAVVVAIAVWLAVLTFVLVLVVRQIALITMRLEAGTSGFSPSHDGLDVGFEVPAEVTQEIPEAADGLAYVLLVSPTCGTCRELVTKIASYDLKVPLIALVPGEGEPAAALVELFPPVARVIRDPLATALAEKLQITSTPFVIEVETSTVTGKAYLFEFDDLVGLIENRDETDAAEIAEGAREVRARSG